VTDCFPPSVLMPPHSSAANRNVGRDRICLITNLFGFLPVSSGRLERGLRANGISVTFPTYSRARRTLGTYLQLGARANANTGVGVPREPATSIVYPVIARGNPDSSML
jgi:hypothetical protein